MANSIVTAPPTAGRPTAPMSVAWLELIGFAVSTAQLGKRDVRYVVEAHHRPSDTRWEIQRTFDELQRFRRSLQASLQRGHLCKAQCPWLYSFVTSCFPKPSLFRSPTSDRVTRERCELLSTYFETLRTALLNRDNHQCDVMTRGVAETVTIFVCAREVERLPLKKWAIESQQAQHRSASLFDTTATASDDEEAAREPMAEESVAAAPMTSCGVCDRRLERHYTTRLKCGHQFHDECLVERLNACMMCPTCGRSVAK